MSGCDLRVITEESPPVSPAKQAHEAPRPLFHEGLGRDRWAEIGRDLSHWAENTQWEMGEWALFGEASFGERTLREVASGLKISAGKLSNCRLVAKNFPAFRRRNALSFSHHLEVARLPQAEGDEILARAEADGWTREQIRKEAREARAAVLACLVRENEALRAENARLKTTPAAAKDAARDLERRAKAAARKVSAAFADLARVLGEAGASAEITGLHGNARAALDARLKRIVCSAGRDAAGVQMRFTFGAGE